MNTQLISTNILNSIISQMYPTDKEINGHTMSVLYVPLRGTFNMIVVQTYNECVPCQLDKSLTKKVALDIFFTSMC